MADNPAPITRRDFLNGVPIAVGGAVAAGLSPGIHRGRLCRRGRRAQDPPGYYPPPLNGLRGSHAGPSRPPTRCAMATTQPDSLPSRRGLRSGRGRRGHQRPGGRALLPRAPAARRILILDNHDDFGGHAKRNEFKLGGRIQLLNGGTLIDSPRPTAPWPTGCSRSWASIVALAPPSTSTESTRASDCAAAYSSIASLRRRSADRRGRRMCRCGTLLRNAQLPATPRSGHRARRRRQRRLPARADVGRRRRTRLSRMSYRDFLRELVKADPRTRLLPADTMPSGASASTPFRRSTAGPIGLPGLRRHEAEPGLDRRAWAYTPPVTSRTAVRPSSTSPTATPPLRGCWCAG